MRTTAGPRLKETCTPLRLEPDKQRVTVEKTDLTGLKFERAGITKQGKPMWGEPPPSHEKRGVGSKFNESHSREERARGIVPDGAA